MIETQAQRSRQRRGSALLLTLLLTLVGAMFLGLGVDAMSLVWVRSNAQTTANLAAAAVALELTRNPSASHGFLEETARSAAARNGYRHGVDSATVRMEQNGKETTVLIGKDAGVYFLRVIRPEPVSVRASAIVAVAARSGE